MKNKLFYFKIILLSFFLILNQTSTIYSKDLQFKATEILSFEEGDVIVGKNNAEAIIDGEFEIFADKFTYYKVKDLLIAEGNVLAVDLLKDIKISSNKIDFNKTENQFFSYGKTFFELEKKYKLESADVFYSINNSIISSKKFTKIKDNLNNNIQLSSFNYSNISKILKGNNIELVDNE